MICYRFNRSSEIPIVTARISGPRSSRLLRLVFDTGAGISQIDEVAAEAIGFSNEFSIGDVRVKGAAGVVQNGYKLKIPKIEVFSRGVRNATIAVFDYSGWNKYRIDGVLGFDLIKNFHIEMNGPKAEFIVHG